MDISEITVGNVLETEELILTKLKFGFHAPVSQTFRSSLKFHEWTSFLTNHLLIGFEADILGRAVRVECEAEAVPATWWDHFVLEVFPQWAKTLMWKAMRQKAEMDDEDNVRWFDIAHKWGDPVRYRSILRVTNEYHMCPHLELGEVKSDSVHIHFLKTPKIKEVTNQ